MINQDWDIKPRTAACGKCQQPFADHQEYVSRLTYGPEGYVRLDCCAACWSEADRAPQAVSVWHGVFEMPPPAPPEPLKKETAESLLRALVEKNDPANGNVMFILAVMLERRRLLVERDVRKEAVGKLVRIYEHRKTGDTFIITDPQLRLDQIEHVQTEVMAMLSAQAIPATPPSS
ncbi:MAG: hypothetical protein PHW60_14400 [Kiritimatiellae bacterium]|nr:hypothetical protein [Kiritimatiellia bacterium]